MEKAPYQEQSGSAWSDGATSDGTTRQRILHLLLAHGPLTAHDLADSLQITTVAVRRHLAALADAGDVEIRDQEGPRGRGRPAKDYILTEQGRHEFGQSYDALAIQALSELVAVVGEDAIGKLAEQRLAVVESEYKRLRADSPEANPVELLAQALNASGYFASTPESGELCQHHCPVSQVAAQFPQLCEAETRIFSRLLGADLSRTSTIAHGDFACRTHLDSPTMLPNPTTVPRTPSER